MFKLMDTMFILLVVLMPDSAWRDPSSATTSTSMGALEFGLPAEMAGNNDLQLESQEGGTREAWVKHFPNATSPALDLLQQLLKFDPEQRTSAEDAPKHEYLKQFHFEEVERNAPCKVSIHPPDYEKKSTAHYRERLYKEVTKIRNEDKKREDIVLQENRVGTPNTAMPRRR